MASFRFEHPYFLNLLWAAPALLLLLLLYRWWRKRGLDRLGAPASVQRLLQGWSEGRFWGKNVLFLLGLCVLAIAWANPQLGAKKQTATQKSADVFIAFFHFIWGLLNGLAEQEEFEPNRRDGVLLYRAAMIGFVSGLAILLAWNF